MDVKYSSTRGAGDCVTASQAILRGLAEDGGLYVPDHIPSLTTPLSRLAQMSYQEVALEVMQLFLTDFTKEELQNCINKAYEVMRPGKNDELKVEIPEFFFEKIED